MTEKRFTIDKDGITVIDNCTDGLTECKYSNEAKLLCNFLNELADENEQLKKEIENGKEYCKTLETDLGNCADNRILLQKENNELAEENKRLRRCINEIYTIARLEEV